MILQQPKLAHGVLVEFMIAPQAISKISALEASQECLACMKTAIKPSLVFLRIGASPCDLTFCCLLHLTRVIQFKCKQILSHTEAIPRTPQEATTYAQRIHQVFMIHWCSITKT